jgi:hypothetical protein
MRSRPPPPPLLGRAVVPPSSDDLVVVHGSPTTYLPAAGAGFASPLSSGLGPVAPPATLLHRRPDCAAAFPGELSSSPRMPRRDDLSPPALLRLPAPSFLSFACRRRRSTRPLPWRSLRATEPHHQCTFSSAQIRRRSCSFATSTSWQPMPPLPGRGQGCLPPSRRGCPPCTPGVSARATLVIAPTTYSLSAPTLNNTNFSTFFCRWRRHLLLGPTQVPARLDPPLVALPLHRLRWIRRRRGLPD